MPSNVLLVDDDREMLLALREGLGRHADSFSVLLAGDGIEALHCLERHPVSLVVTDLKMPRMDGFELLAAIMGTYPDVPVIIITGFSTPDMERLARQGGAVAFIAKPFLVGRLARQIEAMLQKETEGGALHNVSTSMFLQLVEMEEKTCTIRLQERVSGRAGALFFVDGVLLDARSGGLQGLAAAYEIFSWDQVSLSIQNECPVRENRINKDLHLVVLEAARRKDERRHAAPAEAPGDAAAPTARPEADMPRRIRARIAAELGERCGLEAAFHDPVWTERVSRVSHHGRKVSLGNLVTGYVDRGDPRDYIVVGGDPPTVLAVDPKCPRDKILRLLGK